MLCLVSERVVVGSLITLSDLHTAALSSGCRLSVQSWGPAYRLELLSERKLPGGTSFALDRERPELLGFSDGFTQPNRVAHLESIQLRRFTGYYGSRRRATGSRWQEAKNKRISPHVLAHMHPPPAPPYTPSQLSPIRPL